jgi:site-specific DNA-cytosine methylase
MAIELFPCSGGLTMGFRRAGIEFAMSFDRDPDACDSHEQNLGVRPIQLDVRDLLRMARAGWSPGPLDLVAADPPCSPWSRAGKRRGLDDERDVLVETVELVALLRPRAALVGNIPGLDDTPHLEVVRRTIGALARAGYCVDFASLNAAAYGVPQIRWRPFWYAHRTGSCIRWPAPTHADPASLEHPTLPGMPTLRPWVTCREALSHLPLEQLGRPVRLRKRDQHSPQHGSVPERPARTVGTSNLSDGNVLLLNRKHPISEPDEPARVITTKGDGRGAQGGTTLRLTRNEDIRPKSDPSTRAPQSERVGDPDRPAATLDARAARVGVGEPKVLAWPWERPSTVITSRDTIAPPGHHPESGSILSLPDAVVLSELAGALLQGFPPGWIFAGKSKRARWEQIGMAVPIPLAHAIGRSVAEQLGISAGERSAAA